MATSLSSLKTNHCLEVTVIEAKDLKPTNFFASSASDSFCELCVRDQVVKPTEVQKSTLTPIWNEKLQFELPENPEEETLFVSVWGKKLISRNTFIGRVEIPVSLLLKRDPSESQLRFKENHRVERWFKLLPKHGNNQYSEVTGWIRLAFEYKFVPFVSKHNAGQPNPPPGPSGPAKIAYQCPTCSSFYSTEEIQQHMSTCTVVTPQIHQQPHSQIPLNYGTPNHAVYSPPIQVSTANQSGDPSVPSGFSPDRSQPAPNSPPTFLPPSSSEYGSNPFTEPPPVSVQRGFAPSQQEPSPENQSHESLYSAPSYDFTSPY